MIVLTIPIDGRMTKIVCHNNQHHRIIYGAFLTWECNCNETKTNRQ